MNFPSRTLKAGFTLVEVLIVILIIALLMAFIIPQVLRGPAAARDATRIAHVGQIAVALEGYRSAKREYPQREGCLDPSNVQVNATSTPGSSTVNDPVAAALVKEGFLTVDKFPKDPDGNNDTNNCKGWYYYKLTNSGRGFVVFSKLESNGRSTASQSDLSVSSLPHQFTAGGGYYHQSSGQ